MSDRTHTNEEDERARPLNQLVQRSPERGHEGGGALVQSDGTGGGNLDQRSADGSGRYSSVKKLGKGAINVIFLPWQFAMNDDFFNSIRMDSRTREMHHRYQQEKKTRRSDKAGERARRSTNRGVQCVGGCDKIVRIDYVSYDPTESDYLICGESCVHPIGAHKECVRKHMASTGVGRFHYACEDCNGSVHMTGRFRLSPYELPYTIMTLMQFALRHAVFMPFIMCYAWYLLLWIAAWIDYDNGIIPDRPTNPFALRYIMYSATDPTWTWEAHSAWQKWFTGFTFYLIMLPWWKIVIRRVLRWIGTRFSSLLWRYDV
jgi:hypothetical protein